MCPWYVITSTLAETSEVSKTIKLFSPFRCAATKTWRSTASVTWTGKPVGAAAGSPSVVTQALGPSDSITTESANVRHVLHYFRNYDYLADLYWKILTMTKINVLLQSLQNARISKWSSFLFVCPTGSSKWWRNW